LGAWNEVDGLEKGFFADEMKLIHVLGVGTYIFGTWNVAPYHVSGDYGCGIEA
jgi:hypothetical protein